MMVGVMGTDTIMSYVTKAYSRFKERRSIIVPAAKARIQKRKAAVTISSVQPIQSSDTPMAPPKSEEPSKLEEEEDVNMKEDL